MSQQSNPQNNRSKTSIEDLKNLKCVEGYINRIKHNLRFCDELLEKDSSGKTKVYVYNVIEKSKELMREAEIKYPSEHIPFPISEEVISVYKKVKENRNMNKAKK